MDKRGYKELLSNEQQDAISFLRKVLKTYTPSGKERELSNYYINFLKNHQFEAFSTEIGNIIGIKGRGSPVLLLASHLDTIPGELPFKENEDSIFARGAVDCKPSWGAMLLSAGNYDWNSLFSRFNNKGTIILLGIVHEEDSVEGMLDFFKSQYKPDTAIFGEPTYIDRICYAYRGRIWLKCACHVESGHASSSWSYKNSIEILIDYWNRIKALGSVYNNNIIQRGLTQEHFNEITTTLSKIKGGSLSNVTPGDCEMEIDIRTPPTVSVLKLQEEIEKIKEIIQHTYNVSLDISYESKIDGYQTDPNSDLLNAMRWAIYQTTGQKTKILKKTGTTFFNMIADHYKIPVIVFGPGDPRLEHTDKEFISKKEFLQSIDIYSKFFEKFFKLYCKNNEDVKKKAD